MLQILWQNIHSWMRPHRVAYHARNRRLVLDQFWGLYGGVCHIWGMGNYESHALPKLPTLRWSRRCTAEIFCIQTSQIDHPVVACLWIPNPHQKLPKKKKGIAKSLLCLKNLCAETFLVGATQEQFRIVPLHCCCTWQGFLADLALLELSLKNGCPHPMFVSWRIIWGMTRISFSTQTKTVAVASNLAFLPFGGIAIRFSQH